VTWYRKEVGVWDCIGRIYLVLEMGIAFIKMAEYKSGSINALLLSAVYTGKRYSNLDPHLTMKQI
jgi:hypothetical protein